MYPIKYKKILKRKTDSKRAIELDSMASTSKDSHTWYKKYA